MDIPDKDKKEDKLETFIKLIILGDVEQSSGFLRKLNHRQCKWVREIAYNILFNSSIRIPEKERKYFKKNSLVIKLLASKKISGKDKKKIIGDNHPLVRRLAGVVYDYLTENKGSEENRGSEE
jgi:hypothetical protein